MNTNTIANYFSLRATSYLLALLFSLLTITDSKAAYPVHRSGTAREQTVQIVGNYVPETRIIPLQKPAVPGDDSYKGIVALVAGSAGMASLIIALFATAVGLLFPAFLFGVVGIVFGTLRKKTNRGLGRAGLILGIADVLLVLLFLVAVIIALASFT